MGWLSNKVYNPFKASLSLLSQELGHHKTEENKRSLKTLCNLLEELLNGTLQQMFLNRSLKCEYSAAAVDKY